MGQPPILFIVSIINHLIHTFIMTLTEIKAELGVSNINLNRVVTEANEETQWFKDWDNTNRVAILIHEDTLAQVKDSTTLGIHVQEKKGAQGNYTAKTIVVYKPAEFVL
jgi:hypothetical protein